MKVGFRDEGAFENSTLAVDDGCFLFLIVDPDRKSHALIGFKVID
jgi:hypothetical protein